MNTHQENPVRTLLKRTMEGSVVGGATVFLVTPGLYWTNVRLNNGDFKWSRCMTGWKPYVTSVGPVAATAFATDHVVCNYLADDQGNVSDSGKMLGAGAAGLASGIVNAPGEAAGQNSQLSKDTKLKTLDVFKHIYKANGLSGITRGTGVIMFRESVWDMTYMVAIPWLNKKFQDMGLSKNMSDGMAAATAGGAFGAISTPLYVIRFEQQKGLMQTKPAENAFSVAKRLWTGQQGSLIQKVGVFYKAVGPRTLTGTAAGYLMYKGKEQLDQLRSVANKR